MWLNLVELSVWVREVACSNRVIPIVALAELVMHRIVVPDYAGSNPVGHLLFARRQVVWHSTFNREGAGSNPAGRTEIT